MPPLLSVLMPSIPERSMQAHALWQKIELSAGGAVVSDQVELLMFRDNKKRSIGLKRQALLEQAHGEYICFVDDDDDVQRGYLELICGALRDGQADVLTFDTICVFPDQQQAVVTHSLDAPIS